MRKNLLIFFFSIFLGNMAFAQTEKQIPTDLLDAIVSQVAENQEKEEVDETQLYEDLQYFLQNPINLNFAKREDLEKLQFLTTTQIDNLMGYVKQYGPMENLYELQLIDGFYGEDIRFLLPFVTLSKEEKRTPPLKFKNIFKYGRHEILARMDKGLETREGYRFVPEEELIKNPNKQYIGDPYYASLKYHFNYSNRVLFGLTAEKDAGEQFWGDYNKGFDFYSAYLQVNDIWKFKTITAGNYSASFGQGLVMNQSFGYGKSSMVLDVEKRNEGLRKYSSTDEYNYLQGVGATIRVTKTTELTAFYSNKKIDGNGTSDSTDTFTSIKTDGYHYTVSEFDKKHTVGMQVIGGHISQSLKVLNLGFTVINTQFDHDLVRTPSLYNQFYFSGDNITAGGIDYKARWRKFYLFGETAYSDQNAWATVNGLTVNPTSTLSLVAMYRYYSPQYDQPFSVAFGESSRVNNEKGLYIGAEVRPFRGWKFSAYADGFQFPWLKDGTYGTAKPSDGYDLFFQADYMPKRNVSMYWRVKYEMKEANNSADSTLNVSYNVDDWGMGSARYVLQYSPAAKLKLRSIIQGSYARKYPADATFGYLLRQDLSYDFKFPLSVDLCYEFFDATNYDNRIYAYEQDILYAFSVPALYGRGSRYFLNARYALNKNLTFYFKIGQTVYLDKDVISDGISAIDGNRKTDVRFLVKWRF